MNPPPPGPLTGTAVFSAAPAQRRSSALWLTLTAALLGWTFDGMEMGIFPLIARPAIQEMLKVSGDQEVGLWMGRLTALFLLGAAGGGLVFGWLGDKLGRVRAMSLSILVYSVFTGCCYFAAAPWQLAVLRFVAALGMGGEWSLGVALVMETWPERLRPWLAGAIGAASNVGLTLVGVIASVFPVTHGSWRWLMILGAAPALLTFVIRMFVPESERWQAAVADVDTRPVREIFSRPLLTKTLLAITFASVSLIGTWGSVQWIPLWADQLAGPDHPSAKALVSALMAAGAILGCFVGSLSGKLSRRGAYCGMCLGSFGICALLFRGIDHFGAGFLVVGCLIGMITAAVYGWLPLYLPELFPTRVRATAQGVSFNFGRIFAAVGALGAGRLVNFYHGDYARMGSTITLIYFVGAVLIWFAPETKNKPLPA